MQERASSGRSGLTGRVLAALVAGIGAAFFLPEVPGVAQAVKVQPQLTPKGRPPAKNGPVMPAPPSGLRGFPPASAPPSPTGLGGVIGFNGYPPAGPQRIAPK